MKKIKLYSIGNDGKFNYYIFDKKNEIVKILFDIFSKVLQVNFYLEEEYHDKKERWKFKKINFEKYIDIHTASWSENGAQRIDLFFGKKKIFVSIQCDNNLRLKFNKELFKIATMSKPKKNKKIK